VHGLGLTDDFLLQLSDRAQTAKIEGATPASYDLPPRTSLEEAIQDAWDDARKAWLKSQQHGTDTWAGWVRPLLKALDYSFTGGGATGGKYAVNHLSETGDVPLHFTRQADLDRVTDETGLRVSPHGLIQGYLNATPEHLWGLVTNGETLRLLRDNAQVTRPAYVEFQIGDMLRTEDARAFRVLWLLLHRTRLRGGKAGPLEGWNETSKELGQRANDTLRDGVQLAIEHLGTGFLARNPDLLERTRSGEVTAQDLYRAALTTVYQMVFLFVTEDRDLMFARDEKGDYVPDAQTRARAAHYLTRALRQKAGALHGSPTHTDAYAGWERLLGHLRNGFAPLGLPALGSLLFQPNLLSGLKLGNEAFYNAVRALSEISVNGSLRPVNYAGLDSEELGSIYESLLELVPRIEPGPRFSLTVLPGNERKSTGSYYTPSSLINLLLDSALNPVIDEAVQDKLPEDAMAALKGLKVIDPACGSGHFLIAAARRIGARLAELEEETSVPSPRALRKATRTVIAHCIYGVDINPMAIELAKVALWLESQDAGKPLAFLDHRLRVGNSLLGTTPELMNAEDEIPQKTTRGVTSRALKAHTLHLPDEAFGVLEGDDKKTVSELKKRNKFEREALIRSAHGEQSLFDISGDLAPLIAMVRALGQIEPDSAQDVQAQESTYYAIRDNARLQAQKRLADTWCAAFVASKLPGQPVITTSTLHTLKRTPDAPTLSAVNDTVEHLAEQYRFLHPHIEFPDVFGIEQKGGFDCVVGNPPWEQIQLDPQEFFAASHPQIANAKNMAARERLIDALRDNEPSAHNNYLIEKRVVEGLQHYIHNSGRYPTTSFGRINTAPLFAELALDLTSKSGFCGLILPVGIATDNFNKYFFQKITHGKRLIEFTAFENERYIFPGVHHAFKFAVMILSNKADVMESQFAFYLRNIEDARDRTYSYCLSNQEISLLNPNTLTAPVFRNQKDAKITSKVYQSIPVLITDSDDERGISYNNPWQIKILLMYMMNTGSRIFKTKEELESTDWKLDGNIFELDGERMVPVYEAKMIHQFDHRFGTYANQTQAQANQNKLPEFDENDHANTLKYVLPNYFVDLRDVEERMKDSHRRGFVIAWRDISLTTNVRTMISAVLPEYGFGGMNVMFSKEDNFNILHSVFNSFIFDYVVRQKLGGTHINQAYIKQFPVLPPSAFTHLRLSFIAPRVLELTFTAHDLTPFARDMGYAGNPFIWNDERRFWLRAELDALYFILYGIDRADVEYIMETFPIVKRKDVAAHGSYRTKEAILSVFDELTALGLERLREYRSRVPGGDVAGGWAP
jgi:type II restriction/modification system DNA methylase subunit YeeA